MKKIIFALVVFGLMIYPSSGMASTLPLGISTDPVYINPSCSASVDMSFGSVDATSHGGVSILQNFLVSKGFLVMPIGVPTGYFGPITQSALASYQASVGVSPAVGYFGPITRGYINSHCNSDSGVISGVTIKSIAPSEGLVGSQVTIYGSGFSSTNNTINFGGGVVRNLPSTDGATLTFTVPSNINPYCTYFNPPCLIVTQNTLPGIYSVSVTNGNGVTSNVVKFTVTSNTVLPVLPNVSSANTSVDNSTGVTTGNTAGAIGIVISSLSPDSGPIGNKVTIYGSGFSSTGNSVNFGGGGIPNLSSVNGTSITFTVPSSVNPLCYYLNPPCLGITQNTLPGVYNISVTNSGGTTSNIVKFTVTSNTL